MATRYTDEFRRDAVRIATSGLTRPQAASDLGVGLSTLNKWVQKHQYDDLMIVIGTPLVRETMTMPLRRRQERERTAKLGPAATENVRSLSHPNLSFGLNVYFGTLQISRSRLRRTTDSR